MRHRLLTLLLFLLAAACPADAYATEPDPLALKFHLMHPRGESSPGDPNAAFHLDGIAHLHYILNHEWNGRRSFSFVHVTSTDLLHWTWQPTKLQPSFTGHGMFSGTGFLTKEGKPAVIYHGQGSKPARNFIAVAKDRELSAWEKPYPVEVEGAPEDMRHWDPDCFLIGDTYYAISGGKNPPLFRSDDLETWTYVGPFLSHEPANVVEGEDVSCPNFFPIDLPDGTEKWMLLCISHPHGCRYYLGDWDVEKEQFVPETHGRLNWPKEGQSPDERMFLRDIFAPESVLAPDGRRVMWAWFATLDERLRKKTIQSLPRELSLAEDGSLRLAPLRELETLRHDPRVFEDFIVEPEARANGGVGTKRVFGMGDNAWEIRVTVAREEAERKRFGFRLFTNAGHEGLPITIQPGSGTIRVGTTEAPFAVADLAEGEDLDLRIFIDRYLAEVFANDRVVLAAAHLDGREARGVDAFVFGAPVTFDKIEVWRMKATTEGYNEAAKNRVWEPDSGTSPAKPKAPPGKQGEAVNPTGPNHAANPVRSPKQQGSLDMPPNFVVITVDDLGYADIEPFSHRFETPNLARMAAEGRTFSSFYSASSVCTPSRAALLTGCYPARIDMLHNDLEMGTPNHGVLWPGDRKGLHPDEITIAEMLQARGYATACIGKWHLGDQPVFLPTRQGFDRYFGIPFSNDMAMREPFPRPLPFVRDERVIEELAPAAEGGQDFLTNRFTEEAIRFLEEVTRNKKPGTRNLGKQPFFLYLPHAMIHGPLAASPAFRDSSGKGLRVDAIAEVDWSVGRILDKLRELGVAENTLVLFTSDNGGAYRPGRVDQGGGSNLPYSGGKGSPAEGGFRVPTIAWWPGTIPEGTSTDLIASTVDLLPTFAALSGEPHQPQADRPIDGLDLSSLFHGELPENSPRDSFVFYTDNMTEEDEPRQPRKLTAVRKGPWKLYTQRARFPLAGGKGAGVAEIEPGALFHVVDDPAETTDVSADHPEALKELRAFADEVAAELGEKVGEGSGFRPAGFVPKDEAKPLNDRTEAARNREKPDVLFIAIDDMNDWTTLFDPNNPIHTPNLERLAARGAFFSHAYCATPGCNPSRTAVMTGLRPTTSGVYQNNHEWRKALPDAVTLPQYFAEHGYVTRGGGKILHHGPSGGEPEDNPSFQEFFERIHYPRPRIRDGAFGCFDWGAIPADEMADTPMIEWAEQELGREHDAPLFLAAGIFMPHLPHFAPPEIFERYPFDQVVMPPVPPDDLDDVPPLGIEMARKEWELWKGYLFDDPPPEEDPASLKNLVRAYQASSTYADDMVGRLLDRLDETGRADNTIIVLWSDHGYHLGDKQSTVKFTLWEKANHVPFLIVAPGIVEPGTRIDTPVSLVEIYATLADLAGLPEKDDIDSRSLVPLLKDPDAEWKSPALMTMGRGNHAIRTPEWRYIRYADGTEELYDCRTDGAWNHDNLLVGPEADEHAPIATELRKWLPEKEAEPGPEYRRKRPKKER